MRRGFIYSLVRFFFLKLGFNLARLQTPLAIDPLIFVTRLSDILTALVCFLFLMSTAIYRRLPVAASKMEIFEKIKIYRDAAGAAPKILHPSIAKLEIHQALVNSVMDVTFLQNQILKPSPVDLTLTNKHRDTDPYLTPWINDITKIYKL